MGAYVIWKFARNKAAASKFLIDLETGPSGRSRASKFLQLPVLAASVPNIDRRVARDPVAKPPGKYRVLAEIAEKYTLNPGWPGNTTAAIDEIFSKFMIPQMFAGGCSGQADAVGERRRSTTAPSSGSSRSGAISGRSGKPARARLR